MVTISCITYNHEKYIADAIESFLMQKTNFKFEIIIHDDASIDNTPSIIKKYEEKYPDIIKPIYQQENQYSQGNFISKFITEKAKGKYIAICEGDDYWIDSNKIQKQFDYMEEHPDCSLCVNGGYIVNAKDKKIIGEKKSAVDSKFFTVEDSIAKGGGLFLTNSMFYRREYDMNLPKFLLEAPVGDYPLTINLALQGKVYYMKDLMSAYRVGDSQSWTAREALDIKKNVVLYKKLEKMLLEVDNYTKGKYRKVIYRTIFINRLKILAKRNLFFIVKAVREKYR